MAGTRPSSPTRWADTASTNRATIDTGLRDVGFPSGALIPAGENNQRDYEVGEWLTYLSALSPASDVLDFREWRCPDDSAFTVEWDGPGGVDGFMLATVAAFTVSSTFAINLLVGSGGGVELTDSACFLKRGAYGYAYVYNHATKTVTSGNPPVSETVFWQRAMTSWATGSMTITQESVGATVYQSASLGTLATGVSHLPAWDNPTGEPAGGTATTFILTDCTIRLRQLTESIGTAVDATVSIEWFDRTRSPAAWVVAATANLTTAQTPVAAGVDVTIPAVTTAADATILRGAPMRLSISLAAVVGATQTLDIFYTTIRGIKSRAE